MSDALIRGLSEDAVARIDAYAAACGLPQEYLRQGFEREGTVGPVQRTMTASRRISRRRP